MSINVANNNPHVVYTVAEGATQTTFSITFEFFDDDEVQLYVDGIIKTQGSGDGNYTITGGEGSTGTATFNTVSSGIQPVTGITGGSQVVIARNIPIERVTDFSAGSDINRAALNTQLDTLTAIAADNKMRSVRALTAPITDPTDVGTSLVIPKAADRANGFLSFDSNGNAAINSVVDLSFLTLERLDIDNVRIDGNTVSSTTGSLILAPTADVEINIPASNSLYMQHAGTTALDFAFTSVSQEVRFINTTTATTYSAIQSNHFSGTDSDLVLKSDGGPLVFDVGNGTIPIKDDGVQRGYLDISTANTIELYTGTGSGTLNTTFDGADVTIAGELVVSGNLTVDGTTTTINSTTLTVDDKNIVLASGASTSLAADGAGITIDGASATLTYVHLTGAMTFNKDVDIGDNDIENAQLLHFTENVYLYPTDGDDSILNLQAEDTGSAQLRFITGTGSGVFRGGIVASQNNVFGLKDSNEQTFIKSQEGNLPTQILHTYDSPSAGSSVRIEAGSNFVKLYGSEGVEAQKYKDADDTSYYLEPASTSVLATVGATELNVDNITIDGNTISSTDTDGNINLRCNGNGVVDVDSELFVYGNAINGTSAYVQIGNADTGGDDVRIQGPNPNFSLYDSTAVADGVAAYTGGVNFYGQKTNTAYHKYSTIRPRIINGLDSDTAKTGALHFGVSDGASAAATNIIFKIEPDGIEVAGNITSTNDPLKISATTASASANIILEGDTSPILSLRASGSNDDKISFKSDGAFQYINTKDQLTIQTGTNDALFLFGSSNIRTDALGGTHTISSRAGDISFITGTIGSTTERMRIAGTGGISVSADMSFGDSDKAIFGAGSDLQIYHDGSNSIINEQGDGDLLIYANNLALLSSSNSEYFLQAATNGAVSIRYDNSIKLATTSTGVDVTGTVTADGLTVDGDATIQNTGNSYRTFTISANRSASVNTLGRLDYDWNGTPVARIHAISGTDATNKDNGDLVLSTSETGTLKQRIFIDQGGDISFFEDTGTTAKFFWDASAESLGIGTSSPSTRLTVGAGVSSEEIRVDAGAGWADLTLNSNSTNGGHIYFNDGSNAGEIFYYHVSDYMAFNTAGQEAMRIASTGELLVGTTSDTMPAAAAAGQAIMAGTRTFIATETGGDTILGGTTGSNFTAFYQGGTERMRINAGGNVGIGTDSPSAKLEIKDTVTASTDLDPTAIKLYNSSDGGSAIEFSNAVNGKAKLSFGVTSAGGGTDDTYIGFSTSANTVLSEAMRLDSSGNVGIGTDSPSRQLSLYGSAPYMAFQNATTGAGSGDGLQIQMAGADAYIWNYENSFIAFGTNGSEAMRIDSSGNLLVGRTSQIHGGKVCIDYTNGTTAGMAIKDTLSSGTGVPMQVVNGSGTIVGSISQNQSSTSFNTTSDHRLKENVVDLTGATTRLKQLAPKRFNFIADPDDTTVDGFIAHEVQTVVPEAITGTHNEVDDDGNPVYQGIDQSKLVPLLVATIKELEARITALENA